MAAAPEHCKNLYCANISFLQEILVEQIILCSCRKHGLKWFTAFGDSRGEGCGNAENIIFDSEEDINAL